MNKRERREKLLPIQEGYQPRLTGLKGKDGQPLQSGALDPKKLKPPKDWDTAIQPPKPPSGDKR